MWARFRVAKGSVISGFVLPDLHGDRTERRHVQVIQHARVLPLQRVGSRLHDRGGCPAREKAEVRRGQPQLERLGARGRRRRW